MGKREATGVGLEENKVLNQENESLKISSGGLEVPTSNPLQNNSTKYNT